MHAPPLVSRMRLRRAPLAFAAVCFALGIGAAHVQLARPSFTPLPLLLGALALLAALSIIAMRISIRLAWLPVAAAWMVLGFAAAQWQPSPAPPTALMTYADNLSRTIRGTVVRVHPGSRMALQPSVQADTDQVPPWESTEEAPPASAGNITLDLALDSIEEVTPATSTMVPVTGGIRVMLYDPAPQLLSLQCGDRLEMPLRLKPPQRFRDPGVFQYGDYLLGQGIALEAGLPASRARFIGVSSPTARCRLIAAQSWASERLIAFTESAANRLLPRPLRLDRADAMMLAAMLFGDRTGLSHGLRVGFERTGTFHLFVVSGLHIALLAAGVSWLLARLRTPQWLAALLTIAAATGYTALTGFGQPAQRALVMTSVYLLARMLSRDRDAFNALGAAVLAVAGVVALEPVRGEPPDDRTCHRRHCGDCDTSGRLVFPALRPRHPRRVRGTAEAARRPSRIPTRRHAGAVGRSAGGDLRRSLPQAARDAWCALLSGRLNSRSSARLRSWSWSCPWRPTFTARLSSDYPRT